MTRTERMSNIWRGRWWCGDRDLRLLLQVKAAAFFYARRHDMRSVRFP